MKRISSVFGAVLAAAVVALPSVAGAQINSSNFTLGAGGSVFKVIIGITQVMQAAVPFLIAVAVIYFLWNVLQYVINAGNDEARKTAQNGILYGIIGIVVMISFWGLIAFVQSSFGLNTNTSIAIPGGVNPITIQ